MTGPHRGSAGAPLSLHDAAAPLALLAVIGGGAGATVLTWVAATAAAPAGVAAPGLGAPMLAALLHASAAGDLDPLIGPDGSRIVFWMVLGLLLAPLAAAVTALSWWAATRHARIGTPEASLASRRDYADMHGAGAVARARGLRPSLGAGPIAPRDLGALLGATPQGDHLFASEEDVALIQAGPRSNKTSALVVPAVLTAPGPVITTSNKIDVFTLTCAARRELGRVFVLDPQCLLGLVQDWWFNPLTGIRDTADAGRLMTHFVATVGGGSDRADPYFTPATERLLNQLALAAALTKGSLRDVRRWLATRATQPVQILIDHNQHDPAAGLTGLLESPEEQKGGVYETALTALAALESETIARYVTPPDTWLTPPKDPDTVVELDPWRFLVGYKTDNQGRPIPHDTLYALTQEASKAAAPVVAALVDKLLLTATAAATAQGGRLNPPLRAVLDEAANICPIRNLPDLYSFFGSMSIQVMTFLQSEAQGTALWGKEGMRKLETAATIWLIGAGSHDTDFCDRISRLIGEHDVPTWSDQRGRGGGSTTRSYRRDRILSAADIGALPKTHAVLLSSGRRGGLIRLLPWYTENDADQIATNAATATDEVRAAAVAALGTDNPLAQVLAASTAHTPPHHGGRR